MIHAWALNIKMNDTFTFPFSKKFFLAGLLIIFSIADVFAQATVVSSFSPASGPIGTSVTIAGSGFNTNASKNIVFFGATMAKVSSATSTSLIITVPAGATYQPISVLNLGNSLIGYSSLPFITTFLPVKDTINKTTFSPKVSYGTGYGGGVSVSDLDGDGKPDLILGTLGGITIFRNKSVSGVIDSNSFTQVIQVSVTGYISLAVGDIDGDGKPDIVTVNQQDSIISVYRNTSTVGSISFAAPVCVCVYLRAVYS
jgi:hypothetical protein